MGSKAAWGEAIVRGQGLHKEYRLRNTRVNALRGVDITIEAGEFVAIMGPSGCGKSTLLNILAGLDDPTSGEVFIEGEHVGDLGEGDRARMRRQKIGFVFQSFDLLPLLVTRDNVEFPLALASLAASERRRRAEEMLANVGLADKADALIDELSGGQKQRVAIARTLVSRPRIIFADEPTGSLDSKTGSDILALLRAVVDEQGTAVAMVTHDANDAHAADRIVRLRDGLTMPEAA